MKNDSFLFLQRRPTLTSSKRFDHEFQFLRSSTTSKVSNPLDSHSQEEYKKAIMGLEKSLKQEKEKRAEAEDKLVRHMKRSGEMEKEFHQILANVSPSVFLQQASSSVLANIATGTGVHSLHSQVMSKFQQSQEQLRSKFQQRYKENLTIMQRKIASIIQLMQQQLKKAYQLSDHEHGELKTCISRLEAVALEIDQQNTRLMKEKEGLEFRVRVLVEERRLLIGEVSGLREGLGRKRRVERLLRGEKGGEDGQSENVQERVSGSGSVKGKSRPYSRGRSRDSSDKRLTFTTNTHNQQPTQVSFAHDLIKSKIYQLPTGKNMKSISLGSTLHLLEGGKKKKEYVSSISMTLGSGQGNTENGGNTKHPPQLTTMMTTTTTTGRNMIQPHHPSCSPSPTTNTIHSLRNMLTRQRQKKLEYQTKLSEIQQKIIRIDRVVVEGLLVVKGWEEQQEGGREKERQDYDRREEESIEGWKVLKAVCDQVKAIVVGGGGEVGDAVALALGQQHSPLSSLAMTLNPVTISSTTRNHQRNQQLLELLKSEEDILLEE